MSQFFMIFYLVKIFHFTWAQTSTTFRKFPIAIANISRSRGTDYRLCKLFGEVINRPRDQEAIK